MTDETREQIRQAVRHFRLPAYEEITDVGLYLDQATRYVNEYMFPLSEDMAITSHMISNYVKRQLIPSPVHRQYSRDQIASLIVIAMTKSLVSLDNLYLLSHPKDESLDARGLYNLFRDSLNRELQAIFGLQPLDLTPSPDLTDTEILIYNMTMAVAHKIYLDVCCTAIARNGDAEKLQARPRGKKEPKGGKSRMHGEAVTNA